MAETTSYEGGARHYRESHIQAREIGDDLLNDLESGRVRFGELDERTQLSLRETIGPFGITELISPLQPRREHRQWAWPTLSTKRVWSAVAAGIILIAGVAYDVFKSAPGPVPLRWADTHHPTAAEVVADATSATGSPDFSKVGGSLGPAIGDPARVARLATVVVQVPGGFGSGVIIHPDGWIVTTYSVVARSTQSAVVDDTNARLSVVFPVEVEGHVGRGETVNVTVYRADPARNLALLKADRPPHGVATLSPRQIEGVLRPDGFLIGSESNGLAWSLSQVSINPSPQRSPDLNPWDRRRLTPIAITGDIGPGDCGGPLLDEDYQLIGLLECTTSKRNDVADGLAISASDIRAFVSPLPSGIESVPFDLFSAGLGEPKFSTPVEADFADLSVHSVTIRMTDGPISASTTYLQWSKSRATSAIPTGLWGTPAGGFQFDICLVRRSDQLAAVGYAVQGVVNEIRVGDGKTGLTKRIWSRASDGRWSSQVPDKITPILEPTNSHFDAVRRLLASGSLND